MSASPHATAMTAAAAAAAAAADATPRVASPASLASPARPREPASESSDEGLRMSPAAARRFARRNLRRPSATPDLVTSLVRPPSPDAVYVAPGLQPRLRAPPRSMRAASDRRSGPLPNPHLSSLDIPTRHGGGSVFDLHGLAYVSDPDPSLLCPICHDPLVDPVTTPCDHTFCYRCLRRSIASSPSGTTCPIDRELLSWPDCFAAVRLIRSQLNGLLVKCPHHAQGCGRELRREVVERHATAECRYRLYACPDSSCDKKVTRKPKDQACPHNAKACPRCHGTVDEADLDAHLLSCPAAKTRCLGCWQLLRRSQMDAHRELECDGVEVACPYQDAGCAVRATRRDVGAHTCMCAFDPDTPSGAVIRAQQEAMRSYGDVASQLRDVRARLAESDRRVDELASARWRPGGDALVHDKRTMQDLDAGFEEVHQNLTQLEARQSMWTLNQVMPIREEVTELRNNINMIRMHVNWLLNRSREEGRVRAANTTGAAAGVRRDGSGEAAPALPERRRSSGTDTDLPRL